MTADLLQNLISDLATQSGITEAQAASLIAEGLANMEDPKPVQGRFFKSALDAESWMSFQACDNAKSVMSRVQPAIFQEWVYWKQSHFDLHSRR